MIKNNKKVIKKIFLKNKQTKMIVYIKVYTNWMNNSSKAKWTAPKIQEVLTKIRIKKLIHTKN